VAAVEGAGAACAGAGVLAGGGTFSIGGDAVEAAAGGCAEPE